MLTIPFVFSRVIARISMLESKGLVKIEQDETRKSRNSIMLTDEGREVAKVAYAKTEDWNEKALDVLEADQRKVLEDALETILEKMLHTS